MMSTAARPVSLDDVSVSSNSETAMSALKLMQRGGRNSLASMTDRFDSLDDIHVEVDIEQFKEDGWTYISDAVKEGGLKELTDRILEDEGDAEHILVAVRTRPTNEREFRTGTRGCIEHLHDRRNLIVRKYNGWNTEDPFDMTFAYDYAFDEETTQDQVFKFMGWKALTNAFSGYNVSIFAYGQTGSGKSHSMIGTETDPGLIRRMGEFLFDYIERGTKELGFDYKATVSACEIYNENVRDLLAFMTPVPQHKPQKASKKSSTPSIKAMFGSHADRMNRELSVDEVPIQYDKNGNQMLKIREGKDGVYVEGQSKVEIKSNAEMAGIIFAAIENRMVRATNMNADSSRSHLIFVIEFTQNYKSKTGRQSSTKSKINLIDLAGSERARSTGSSGEGLREGANINKSLSTLGRVISALAEANDKKLEHVPYRDSKLTYILKDSLGGDSKTAMLATISPSESSYDETVSTLRYAASVKRIKTSASQHLEQETGEMIEKLRAEVDLLATELKNQEIQALALAEDHRIELQEAKASARPVVVKDEKEVLKLSTELNAMTKRAERYRSERDTAKKELKAVEARAERYRSERRAGEVKLESANDELSETRQQLLEMTAKLESSHRNSADEESPMLTLHLLRKETIEKEEKLATQNDEVVRLLKRVKELEGLVNAGSGLGDDVRSAIKDRRETGTRINRMSMELESTNFEKMRLEEKLKKKDEQMKDPLAVMSMSISNMFGMGIKEESFLDDDDADGEEDEARVYVDDFASAELEAKEVPTNLNDMMNVRKLPIKADPDILDRSQTINNSGSKATRRASIANKNDAIVFDTLRQQLEESNRLNEALEKKVEDQHAKLGSLRKTMEDLYAVQKALDSKVTTSDATNEKTFADRKLEQEKYGDDIVTLTNEKIEAIARVAQETDARNIAELRLKEVLEAEKRMRENNTALLAAKDSIEDELRSLSAKHAASLRQVTEKLEQSETEKGKLEKSNSKLEKELDKLQRRHAELRAASKKLLSDRAARKESQDNVTGNAAVIPAIAKVTSKPLIEEEAEVPRIERSGVDARPLPVRGASASRTRSHVARTSKDLVKDFDDGVSSQRTGGKSGQLEAPGRGKPRPSPATKVKAESPSPSETRNVTPVRRVGSSTNIEERQSTERGTSRGRVAVTPLSTKEPRRPVLKKRDLKKIRSEEKLTESQLDTKL